MLGLSRERQARSNASRPAAGGRIFPVLRTVTPPISTRPSCSSSARPTGRWLREQGRSNITLRCVAAGKILEFEGLPLNSTTNTELADFVSAVGTGAGDKFDIAGLRYGKIILLMDADSDGYHISTLLMAFIFRHMPDLIRKGHVYLPSNACCRINVGKETH